MPDEPKLEEFLARVRVAGPAAGLRSRILSGAHESRVWPWAAAAAALLGVSLTLHGALDRHAAVVLEAPDLPSIDARVERISNLLGAGDGSRRLATFIVTADELARQAAQLEEEP
jgi:hypothetical protein